MATIKDIVKILVDKHHLKDAAATEFVQNLVEVINEGLIADRIVKIKGFGTFKLQEVKERESVNVNTGEPVTIAAHDKITFTPDSVMRDLVNKPFAQFETVILNETFDNKPKEEPSPKKEPIINPKPIDEPKPVEEEIEEKEEEYEEIRSFPWLKHILYIVIIAAAFFALGFYTSQNAWLSYFNFNKTEVVIKQKKTVSKPVTKSSQAKPATAKPEKVVDDIHKYDNDPRIKYGAYYIAGTQAEVTVRRGQTMKSLAKAYLGPDMSCYIEAYNDKKEIKEGDKIKIPIVKLKKHKQRKK